MKKKIIIPAFALLIGTALAGSISSTVAWYQYSTRTNAAYIGTTAGSSENLQMRIQGYDVIPWTSRITYAQMATYLGTTSYGSKMVPITTGNQAKDAALPNKLYQNPIAGIEAQASWKEATAANYVVIPLEFRYVKRDGTLVNNVDEVSENKQVNLRELVIEQRSGDSTHEDISDAIRVHFSAYNESTPTTISNYLVSNQGATIDTHGALDLDSEPGDDYTYISDKYGFGGLTNENKKVLDYGENGQQASYAVPGNPMNMGNTGEVADKYLHIDVTIWVEGWQKLGAANSESAIWNLADYVASEFQVGFEFEAVDAQ